MSCPNDSASSTRAANRRAIDSARREQPGDDHRQGHALDGGHDLAPVARRDGGRSHRQTRSARNSAYRADPIASTHQPTTGTGRDAEGEDEERVGLHVEPGAERRDRSRAAGHAAVDRVEGERERGQRHQQGAVVEPRKRRGDQGGDHLARLARTKGHHVGRPEPRRPRAVQSHGQQDRGGGRHDQTDGPADGVEADGGLMAASSATTMTRPLTGAR
jgi:hypothetical protein